MATIFTGKSGSEIDRRIRFLQRRLDNVEVVDPASQKSERVLFGATVRILQEADSSDGSLHAKPVEKIFRIVGIDEADAREGRISWISPMGRALLQRRVGDVVSIRTPRGEEEWEILEIRYEHF